MVKKREGEEVGVVEGGRGRRGGERGEEREEGEEKGGRRRW